MLLRQTAVIVCVNDLFGHEKKGLFTLITFQRQKINPLFILSDNGQPVYSILSD